MDSASAAAPEKVIEFSMRSFPEDIRKTDLPDTVKMLLLALIATHECNALAPSARPKYIALAKRYLADTLLVCRQENNPDVYYQVVVLVPKEGTGVARFGLARSLPGNKLWRLEEV